jgi:hypothetical protein
VGFAVAPTAFINIFIPTRLEGQRAKKTIEGDGLL